VAEEIVTRFTADLSDLQAKVKTATATVEGFTESADEAGNAIGAQAKKTGDLEAKTKALVGAEQALAGASNAAATAAAKEAKALDTLDKEQQAAAKSAANLTKQTSATAASGQKLGVFSRITQGIQAGYQKMVFYAKEFAIGAKQGFREAFNELPAQAEKSTKRAGKSVTNLTGKVRDELSGAVRQSASQFGILGNVAVALGPVGVAVAGIAAGLLAVAKNTDAGATAIEGFGRGAGLIFDRVTGKVKDFFSLLESGSTLGNFFQGLIDGAEFFIKTLSPIAPILALLKVTGIADAFKEDIAEGQKIAQLYDDLEDKQNAVNEKTAANEIIIRKNLAALRDTTKTVEERKKLADEITAREKENLEARRSVVQDELAIQERIAAAQKKSKGEVDDTTKRAISGLKAELSNIEADSVSLTERVSARINGIEDADAAKRDARRAKENADAEKAAQQEIQRIEKLSALRAKAAEERTDLENDALRRSTLGDDGQPTLSTATFDIEVQTQKAIDAETAAAAELTALVEANRDAAIAASRGNAKQQEIIAFESARQLEKIEQDKQDTIKLIRAKGEAEITAAQKQSFDKEIAAAKAATAAIEDALLTDDDRQLNAISKKYDELLKLTDKLTVNEAEKGRIRAQLLLARERELTEIIDEEGRKRLEIQVKLIEELGEGVGQALALLATSFSIGEKDINAQFDQQLSDLQEANQRELDEIARRNGSQAELEEARNKATASYMDERNRIEQERGKELQENRERQEKEFLKLLIDTLEKVVQIYVAEVIVKQIADGAAQGGVPGALAGAAIGAAIAAIISGIFSALKSSIGGAYRGEEMIGGPAFFNGSRDTHLRRVHPKERIISADKNVKHYDVLHAIHTDKFDQWKRANLMVEMPAMDHLVMPEINRYLDGDTGQRMAASVMLMKYHDKNIVESTNRTTKAQQKTNVLLEQLVEAVTNKPGRGAHYW
jgi:hypothetical protein